MKNGMIYTILKFIIDRLYWLNLVEYFKLGTQLFNPDKSNTAEVEKYDRLGADIFIICKWLFILILWTAGVSGSVLLFFVWYLLFANLYTYFFYHIWIDSALKTDEFEKDRIRRRFINSLLAITYSTISFAYLYLIPYKSEFTWKTTPTLLHSWWFSISNSLAANYEEIAPHSDIGNSIAMLQLIITFFFVTIIISRTIPQTNSQN